VSKVAVSATLLSTSDAAGLGFLAYSQTLIVCVNCPYLTAAGRLLSSAAKTQFVALQQVRATVVLRHAGRLVSAPVVVFVAVSNSSPIDLRGAWVIT
jgi:hypothetical protein